MTKRMLLRFLDFYRYWISPVIHVLSPSGCKFEPTCSHFASDAIAVHGAWRGGRMALGRLLRCHPFSRGGFDPVPIPDEPEEASGRDSQKSLALPDPLP